MTKRQLYCSRQLKYGQRVQWAEDHSEMEAHDRPFTTVTYKKARPTGIPIIFKLTDPDASFWKVNLNKLASEVVTAAKEKVQSFRVNRDGNFSVSVSTVAASSRLLELTRVAGLKVTPYVPQSYVRNLGKIRHVPIQYSEEQLLEYLKDSGVV
ncbi:hypothetical protein HPB50_015049 [Hyalomma asiaticum]|uniref:Uncharacterized protein n=1 Tax=Hyalomma asiaticum TaxID=266040 RepID=A0ACB7SVN3_HYAAI|nr:hypothetical protein HPB50_015049 [Hyalomma asiaticum]